jgi:hypothetical protein
MRLLFEIIIDEHQTSYRDEPNPLRIILFEARANYTDANFGNGSRVTINRVGADEEYLSRNGYKRECKFFYRTILADFFRKEFSVIGVMVNGELVGVEPFNPFEKSIEFNGKVGLNKVEVELKLI